MILFTILIILFFSSIVVYMVYSRPKSESRKKLDNSHNWEILRYPCVSDNCKNGGKGISTVVMTCRDKLIHGINMCYHKGKVYSDGDEVTINENCVDNNCITK
jgi:hypothetical protein